jgi:integrase
MYLGVECRETLKMAHTKANIKFAERLRGEILNAIEKGSFSYAEYFPESSYLAKFGIKKARTDVTVGQLLDEQFDIYKRTLAPSTYTIYRRNYERLKAKWGTTKLADLTPAALRAWIGDFDTKARTIRQLLIPLRGALDLAVNDDLIEGSPMDRVKLRKILGRDAYKVDFVADPFSAAEIASILSACTGQERNVWQFAFATGMRPSEYIALRWESVDLARLTVRVERARVLGTTTDEVKTYAGKRLIDVRQGAYDALMAQKQHSALANGLVFLDPSHGGGWDSAGRLYSLWDKIVARAGVRVRNPYQTRHTFASTLLSTGENQMYVAKQMGHADTTMITRTYGRWLEQEDGILPDFYRKLVPGAARAIR